MIAPRLIGHLFPAAAAAKQIQHPAAAARAAVLPEPFPLVLGMQAAADLKNQLGLERHGGRVPAGLWARVIQRVLALNACIWHNCLIGAPVKRSLIAYDHV